MKAYVDLQVSSGMYSTADEFLTDAIEREQEYQAKQRVNSLLKTTLQKNKMVEATDELRDINYCETLLRNC